MKQTEKKVIIGILIGFILGTLLWKTPNYYSSYYDISSLNERQPVKCGGWNNFTERGGHWTCPTVSWEELESRCEYENRWELKNKNLVNLFFYQLSCSDEN
jgi:hypothetical protein